MPTVYRSPLHVRLGRFELDLASGELRKDCQKVPLPPKVFGILKALLERPGEVITREELRARLWPADTFVEFDDSLNHAVKRLRRALDDSAETPRFIETLPRYGYRLIAAGVSTAEAEPPIRSLAVLPLANLSNNPNQEYFADGMTDSLIAHLSALRSVKVISRTSIMRYKHLDQPLPQIARELKVDGIIEGTVQRSGRQVRVTVQLLRGASDTHVWSGNYEHDFRDVLALQAEVARAVAREIKATLTAENDAGLPAPRTISPEAYDAYLKGQFHWYKLSPGHLDRALRYFDFALEKDPQFALAYVGIANVWLMRQDAGFMRSSEALPQSRGAALTALKLDETLADAHVVLGNLEACRWDWPGAEREFRRAIELNPNSPDAHFMYADFLMSMKRENESAAEMRRVLELDPLSPFFQCFHGWHLLYLHRYDEAIAQCRESLAAAPGFSSAHLGLWGAFYRKGMEVEALHEALEFFETLGDGEVEKALRRGYREGGYRRAMLVAAETLVQRSERSYVPGVRIARMYAHAGENDSVLAWLERACNHGETPLMHLNVAWDWDPVRGDSRFRDLLRRLGLPE